MLGNNDAAARYVNIGGDSLKNEGDRGSDGEKTVSKVETVNVTVNRNSALDGKKSVPDEQTRNQREEIVRALTECKGRVGGEDGAAARLSINRTTLLSRMKKLGINAKQFS